MAHTLLPYSVLTGNFLLRSGGKDPSVTPGNSLSLRLTGCCPSCEEEDDEVLLKSSGAAAPFPFTSPYGTAPSDAGTPPVAMAALPGGVSAGRPLAVLPFSEEESS